MKKRYTKTQLQELNYNWKTGNLSPVEQIDLDEWEKNLDDDTLYLPEAYKDQPELIRDRITQQVISRINKPAPQQKQTTRLWPKIALVAAAVAALALFIYFFTAPRHPEGSGATSDLLVNDIAPGKNGATITLANGEVIELSGAKKGVVIGSGLKYSDGSTDPSLSRSDISPSGGEMSMMLTASTARGQTYEFIMPDGTHVWLNAASSISFPSQFNGKERKIVLDGEGYFEVAKDKAHPFIVASKGQEVEVLGTHFNISTYQDEAFTKTTLLEGSVRISTDGVSKLLNPGQQAVKNDAGIQISTADTEIAVAWKNNEFMFEDESIESIMKMVERWYNVDVVYQGEKTKEKFVGAVSRFDKVSNVLRILESTGSVHFKIEGRTIYVYP